MPMDGNKKILPGMFFEYLGHNGALYRYIATREDEKCLWVYPVQENPSKEQFFWSNTDSKLRIISQEEVGTIPEWLIPHITTLEFEYEYV